MPNSDTEREPDCVVEFSSMTAAECQVARKHVNSLQDHGAAEVIVQSREGHPSRVEIWAHTQADAKKAADHYTKLCKQVDSSVQ